MVPLGREQPPQEIRWRQRERAKQLSRGYNKCSLNLTDARCCGISKERAATSSWLRRGFSLDGWRQYVWSYFQLVDSHDSDIMANTLSSSQPPPTFQPPPPPPGTATSSSSTDNNNNAGATNNSSSATPSSTPLQSQPDLITRYNLHDKLNQPLPADDPASAGKKAWSSSREERQSILQRRRDQMILEARRKMEAKLAAERAAAAATGGSSWGWNGHQLGGFWCMRQATSVDCTKRKYGLHLMKLKNMRRRAFRMLS